MKHLFLMLGVCLIPFGVLADAKTEILMDKVDRMEAELSFIQRKLYQTPSSVESETSTASVMNNVPANIDELYTQLDAQNQLIQTLTEKTERLEFDMTALKNKLDKMNQDIDFRLTELSAQKEASSGSSTSKVTSEKDKEAYEAAYALLKAGDYEGAEQAFLKFMADYPESKWLGNANYWLGESYYARGQYAEAVGLFADGFTKYKENSKAPDNMLKLGLTMKQLGKKTEACSAFNGLENEFPNATTTLKTRAKTEAKALKCPS
ncbi:MAG: tol-pal system protein YbgF [Alphaproteobacteria bacterium]|nr:tol-pal system protein YbgF [Alphaproteobacteria bacterium]